MLRALPRALRLSRPWRSPGARDCASKAKDGTPEIQVHALTGPDEGKVEGEAGGDPTRRETKAGGQEDWISGRPRVDFVWVCLSKLSGGLEGDVKRRGELGSELCSGDQDQECCWPGLFLGNDQGAEAADPIGMDQRGQGGREAQVWVCRHTGQLHDR